MEFRASLLRNFAVDEARRTEMGVVAGEARK